MAGSVNGGALRTHQNSVRSGLDDVKPVAAKVPLSSDRVRTEQNDAGKAEILALIDEARIAAHLSHKEMQIAAGAAKGPYSEAANGDRGNYAVQWLWAQPATFWMQFIARVQVAKGITQDTEDAMRRQLVQDTVDALWDRMVQKLTAGENR